MRDSEPIERLDIRGSLRFRHPKGQLGSHKVQFETPFPLWCTTCLKPTIIGERTKFNAEKTTVPSSHSRPIYSYRMQHIICGGTIEIRTSPEKGYEVVEGARKKKTRDGIITEEDFTILTAEELAERKAKAFALLEYQADKAEMEKKTNQRTLDLYETSKQFEYPFMPKTEAEAIRMSREQLSRARENLNPYLLEAPPIDRAQHMKEVDDIMRGQKKTTETKVQNDKTKVKQANKAFASLVRRNTRVKLDPFRNASSDFGRGPEPRFKRKRLIEGLQPKGARDGP